MSRLEGNDTREVVSFRIDPEVKDEYQDAVESMTGDLRSYVQAVANADSDGKDRFRDDILNTGYDALRRTADEYDPNGRRLSVPVATSEVAQATGIPKKAVRSRVFKPLEKRGAITPRAGMLSVHPPDAITQETK